MRYSNSLVTRGNANQNCNEGIAWWSCAEDFVLSQPTQVQALVGNKDPISCTVWTGKKKKPTAMRYQFIPTGIARIKKVKQQQVLARVENVNASYRLEGM